MKKDPIVMAECKKPFVAGCVQNGISSKSAEELFDQIAKFADYGFNKSHALAYGITSIQTAWLKRHYPTEFFAACLTEAEKDQDKTIRFINACKQEGIKILPPDINDSDIPHKPINGCIRFGLGTVKGLGKSCLGPLIEERNKGGKFTSFKNVVSRLHDKGMKKSDLNTLIRSGCFDSLL